MDYQKIGVLYHSAGIKNDLILRHHLSDVTGILKLHHVFVGIQQDSFIPFFMKQAPKIIDSQTLSVRFEATDDLEEYIDLANKPVFIERKKYQKLLPMGGYLTDSVEGFEIFDKNSGRSAIIDTVAEFPGHLVAFVHVDGKEILIPLVASFIDFIDEKNQKIDMYLPDGIWEI